MELNFDKADGLVPAVVQDDTTGDILMLAYMNLEAWRETVSTGYATFWSRSRRALWRKGESSGHRLAVTSLFTDCDQDAIVVKVNVLGPGVCHEGYASCFFRTLESGEWTVNAERAFDPNEVYA